MMLDGLHPRAAVPPGQSMQIVARLPGGHVEPLRLAARLRRRYPHPFLLRRPIPLPAGTVIEACRPTPSIALTAG